MSDPANLRISLESKPLPIPYPPAKREDGENFGYVSLVQNPAAIEQIPELLGEAAMTDLVRAINAPDGVFETVRMLHYMQQLDEGFRRVLCLGFVFRDRRLFSQYANCLMFAGNMLQHMHSGTFEPAEAPLLEIQPAGFREEQVGGWVMDIYLSGLGATPDLARDELDHLLARMLPFFKVGSFGA